jgi:hypothetical protein
VNHKYLRVRERVAEELWIVGGSGNGKGKEKGDEEGLGLKGDKWLRITRFTELLKHQIRKRKENLEVKEERVRRWLILGC